MTDNPRAFPLPHYEQNGKFFYQNGMTLRDWFAGQALAGLCAAIARVTPKPGETRSQADARWSYERADAMLAERENRRG